jgi:hypothetical protein
MPAAGVVAMLAEHPIGRRKTLTMHAKRWMPIKHHGSKRISGDQDGDATPFLVVF